MTRRPAPGAGLTPAPGVVDRRRGDGRAEAIARLRAAGIMDAAAELHRILRWGERVGWGAADIERALARRVRREPFSHIAGRRWFWKHEFEVGPAVLDPRPESECLVESVLATIPDRHAELGILDLGTGSGCLLLSLLAECPRAVGIGLDASLAALRVARRNAAGCRVGDRTRLVVGDWASCIGARFDIVVANPPYIADADIARLAPEVREAEPRLALAGGADGLAAFRRLLPQLPRCLAAGGLVAVEFGAGQAEPVRRLLLAAGFRRVRLGADLDGRPRCALADGAPAAAGGLDGGGGRR